MYLICQMFIIFMVKNKKNISVDEKFFNNIFEIQRKKLQQQLGVINLSQANFTKMITGLKIKQLKYNNKKVNIRKKKNNDDFFKI